MKKLLVILGILIMVAASSAGTFLVLDRMGALSLSGKVEMTVQVKDVAKEYDGGPLYASEAEIVEGELLAGHRISYQFTGSQTSVGTSESNVTVKIYDINSVDVTNDYDLTIVPGTITVSKKSITVYYPGHNFIYDGTAKYSEDYLITKGTLATGHKIIPTAPYGIYVGPIEGDITTRVFDSLGYDVTSNYDIHQSNGYSEILKREIEFDLVSYVKTYDGNPFEPQYTIKSGSLAEGDWVKRFAFKNANPSEADEYKVYLDVEIYDSQNEDVTDNYQYNDSSFFTITISPTFYTVYLPNLTKTYDGESFSNSLSIELEKINNDIKNLGKDCEVYIVDESVEQFSEGGKSMILKGEDNISVRYAGDTKENEFKINFIDGSLTIFPKEVYMYLPKLSKYYDNKPFASDIDYSSWMNQISCIGLVGTDTIDSFDFGGINDSGLNNVDAIEETRYGERISITEKPGKSNYTIKIVPSTYEIKKITINISVMNVTRDYTGDTITDDMLKTIMDFTSTSNVPKESISITYSSTKTIKNVGEYTIKAETIEINNVLIDTTNSNYEIEARTDGKLTIKPIYIPIPSGDSNTYTYDNTNHEYELGINDDYKAYINIGGAELIQKNAGTYTISLSLKNAPGENNYQWSDYTTSTKYYYFVIKKVLVEIPDEDTKVFTFNNAQQTYYIQENDDYYTIKGNKQTNAGTYTVSVDLKDKTNYGWSDESITIKTYSFVINKIHLGIPLKDETTFVYNKLEQEYQIDEYMDFGGGPVQVITVSNNKQTNAGTYTVRVALINAFNYVWSDGSSETKTYTFEIKKQPVTVPDSISTPFTYNGGEQTYVLTGNDNYTISNNIQTNAGSYTVRVALNDANNYVWNDGTTEVKTYTFEIKKQSLTVPSSISTPFTYNGSEQNYNLTENDNYTISNNIQTNAGSYTVRVALNDANNYVWNDGTTETKTYDFIIGKQNKNVTILDDAKDFTNAPFDYSQSKLNEMSSTLVNVSFTLNQELSSFITVGTYQLTGNYITVTGEGANNYNITFAPGTLTVNKVYATINHPPISKVYDGKKLEGDPSSAVIDVPGSLSGVSVKSFDLKDAANSGKFIYFGTSGSAYIVNPVIVDSNGKDITGNFNIASSSVSYQIEKRTLILNYASTATANTQLFSTSLVTISSGSSLADGDYINLLSVTIGSQEFTLTDTASLTSGTYDYEDVQIGIRNASGTNVTSGYKITYNYPQIKFV